MAKDKPRESSTAAPPGVAALLSQALVAYTVEFDNEFERRMAESGFPGANWSLILWANLVRFIPATGISVGELARRSLAMPERVRPQLGCLERWGVIALQWKGMKSGGAKRDGAGSGRGIRNDWTVHLSASGARASVIWQVLFAEIDRRWEVRFGAGDLARLRRLLETIAGRIEVELPHGLSPGGTVAEKLPPRVAADADALPLPTLLAQVLLAFTIEFDRESSAPLWLCANSIRVLGHEPIAESDIPRLTGASPETSGIGWQLKRYIEVSPHPIRGRGKAVRLSPRGLEAQRKYHRLMEKIEREWEMKFGKATLKELRTYLQSLFAPTRAGPPRIAAGLIPPPGVVRAGQPIPALGRRDIAPAAIQRNRDLVEQTNAFIGDPVNCLPHFPLWDMNRGFGP